MLFLSEPIVCYYSKHIVDISIIISGVVFPATISIFTVEKCENMIFVINHDILLNGERKILNKYVIDSKEISTNECVIKYC